MVVVRRVVDKLGKDWGVHCTVSGFRLPLCQSLSFNASAVATVVGVIGTQEMILDLNAIQLVETRLIQRGVATDEVRTVVTRLVDLGEL
jgi:hypothetical protein